MDKLKSFVKRFSACNCFSSGSNDNQIEVDPAAKIKSPSHTSDTTPCNTTIIVAHGAFHTQWHYHLYIDAFRTKTDIDRILVPQQSSSGLSPPEGSFDADVKLINATITNELQSGRDVLLVCHSYGGIPGCEALADLPKPVEGRVGRVLGIVFASAFVAEAGQSLVTSKMAGRASWVRIEGALSYVNNPIPTLYNEVNPPCLAQQMADQLVPQASASFIAPTKHETWKAYPCYYVRCSNDHAMVPEEQDYFIARLKRHNPFATVKPFPSDHAPFGSMPESMAELTEEIVNELQNHGTGDEANGGPSGGT